MGSAGAAEKIKAGLRCGNRWATNSFKANRLWESLDCVSNSWLVTKIVLLDRKGFWFADV